MPYKNPEHKRQWEREHRQQRNAQRIMRRLEDKNDGIARNPGPDLNPDTQRKSNWRGMIAFAIGLGVVVIAAFAGINLPVAFSQGAPSDIGS